MPTYNCSIQGLTAKKKPEHESERSKVDRLRFCLAALYTEGCGVRQDFTRARVLLESIENYNRDEVLLGLGNWHRAGMCGAERNDAVALGMFSEIALEDNPAALFFCALMFRDGRGCIADPALAAHTMARAARLGHTDALLLDSMAALADDRSSTTRKGDAAGMLLNCASIYRHPADSGDWSAQLRIELASGRIKGAESIREKAESGDAVAQLRMGLLFQGNLTEGQNLDESARWLERAAENGNLDAMVELAGLCRTGWTNGAGTYVRNDAAAARWLTEAANQGSLQAAQQLGVMSRDGWMADGEFAWEPDMAADLLRRAADAGSPDAMMNLGWMLRDGFMVGENEDEAQKLLVRAAAAYERAAKTDPVIALKRDLCLMQGDAVEALRMAALDCEDPQLCYRMSRLCAKGIGAPVDPKQEELWLSLAGQARLFDLGAAAAHLAISVRTLLSGETGADRDAAIEVISSLASQGFVPAQVAVGRLYMEGTAVPADRENGLGWLREAARAGSREAIGLLEAADGKKA